MEEDSEFEKFVANMTMEAKVYRLVYDPYCYYVYSDPIFAAGDVDKEREFAKVAELSAFWSILRFDNMQFLHTFFFVLQSFKPDGMDEGVLDLSMLRGV